MAEESQFHITVVTQKRRHRPEGEHSSDHNAARQAQSPAPNQAKAAPASAAEQKQAASSSGHAAHTGSSGKGSHHHHRRHYQDYGTVDLGTLGEMQEESRDFTADPNGPTPTQGELQRQFYNKYNDILSRRYFTRNRNKVTRYVIIALLVALIFLISFFGINAIHGSVAETLERPEVSTIPVGTLDLGN